MSSVARFDTWQAADGTNVARFSGGQLETWDGSAWGAPTPGAAVVESTTGSPSVGTVSSGGTTYNAYVFTGDGSITFSEAGFADVLVVGGGGAGNQNINAGNAGGGAGGVLNLTQAYFALGTAVVQVGAGAAGGLPADIARGGESSQVNGYYGVGGGPGGFRTNGGFGGSGGGGGSENSAFVGGPALDGQGGAGGTGFGSGTINARAGGGGGGGSASGGNASSSNAGAGGDGKIVNIITTALATSFSVGEVSGSDLYFGGGGGGSSPSSGSASGGLGGGSNGNSSTSSNATANTGGGAGGAGSSSGNGGSGVVIVRVAV